jgi:hypothetical protein
MKLIQIMLCLCAVFGVSNAFATSIDIVTAKTKYTRWPEHIASFAVDGENALDDYLGNALECRLVRLDVEFLSEPKWFKKGEYFLKLTATCNKSFRNFKFTVIPGPMGEPWEYEVSYQINGRTVRATVR